MESIEHYFIARSKREKPKRQHKIKQTTEDLVVPKGGGSPWRHTKTGYRPDLDMVVRSGWEANICRVLLAFDISFEFEPFVFHYPIKRGTRSYTPDLYLKKTGEWVEVKGFFDKKSKIKIKRFRKYYPEHFEKLTMIIGNSKDSIAICQELNVPFLLYQDISKAYKSFIKNWEGK